MHQHDRYTKAKLITLIGALINALLGVTKLLGGIFFHSHALVADALHSFSDLFTDAMVLFASKYGGQQTDDTHPYGHQRIETAATLFLAMLMILTGTGIAWDSLSEWIQGTHTKPGTWALGIAFLSVVANEALFQFTHRVGTHIESDLIIANAWHHRSDAASSLTVLAGLVGSLAGFIYFDAVAAIIVGLLIVHMGIMYGWNSIKELVDTAVNPEQIKAIERIIEHIDGVKRIHQLRTRTMGRDVFIDVHVLVSPFISVSEGHYIAQKVHHDLILSMPTVKDVTVHIDPEDDEQNTPSLHLPSRNILEQTLINHWQKTFPSIESWMIHYLDGTITIDLICSSTIHSDVFYEQARADLVTHNYPIHIRLFTQTTKDNPW